VNDACRVELLERIGQRARRGAVASAGVTEKDQDAGRAARWCGLNRRRRQRSDVRPVLAYLRRAAARRAIQRMLYWASK